MVPHHVKYHSDWRTDAAGVKRISFAGSLYRAAMTGLLNAAREIKGPGTFNYLQNTLTTAELNVHF